jgi:preprotein translocase subunit SecG
VTSHITLSLAAIFGNVVRSLVEFLNLLFSLLRKNRTMGDDPHLANMWSPSSSWFLSSFVAPLLSTLMHLVFLHLVGFDVAGIKNQAHANQFLEKLVFSSCLLISSLQFVVMWRFSTIGATIYTVRKTVTSGAVNQTLFIFGLIFISVTLILLVWKEDSDSILILAAFRGWLFADGDGFNAMGFNKGLTTQVVFCMAAAFFFNVMTLNIIIAVYGHEYDKAQENLKFMFMKGRAHYCASSILSSYLFPWRGALLNYTLKFCAWLLIISSFCLSIYMRSVIIAGLLLGLGQRLYAMSLMQCDWFSPEGDDVEHHQRFLWVCYPEDWASWMSPDDYAGGSSGGNDSDREPAWTGERITSASSLSAIKDAENMESKLAALRQEMDKLMDAMEAQVRNQ